MRHAYCTIPVPRYGSRTGTSLARGGWMALLALFLLASAMPPPVSASEFRVRVFERGGSQPLSGVSVCLGTPANFMQFGADQTDGEGYAVFADVPRTPLLITASKSGYKGEQQSLVTSTIERLLVMSLPTGGGGPLCTATGNHAVTDAGGLRIGNFDINKGAAVSSGRQVHLNHVVNGRPNQFRASEYLDISAAPWQTYSADPVFVLSPEVGKKTVYFQVRRYSTINGADIQTLSPVVHDSIILQGQ